MKKTVIGLAIAASLLSVSTSALAADDTWSIVSPSGEAEVVHGVSPMEAARQAIDAYRKKGILSVYASVDNANHRILLHKATSDATGSLAEFIPTGDDLNINQLNRDMPLIRDYAHAHGGNPVIHVGAINQSGDLPIETNIVPANTQTKGIVLSSFGPRYSGSDVISGFASGSYDGWLYSSTATAGLPFLTPHESRGGYYYGFNGEGIRPFKYGEFVLGTNLSVYKEGGKLEPLDITGQSQLFYTGIKRPYSWGTPGVRLEIGRQLSHIGIADISGSQTYTALRATYELTRAFMLPKMKTPTVASVNAAVVQGMSASTSGYGLGRINLDPNFTTALVDITANQNFGKWTASLAAGGQVQRGVQPMQLDFYLGGANRGSGYFTGAASSPTGAYGGIRIYTPPFTIKGVTLRPFAGYNQSVGQPMIGHSLRAASAELGAQVSFGQNFSGDIGYARITDHNGAHDTKGRLIFNIITKF